MTSFPPSCQLCVERGIVYQRGDKKLCIAHKTACREVFLCAFITTPCIFSNIFKLISLPISFNLRQSKTFSLKKGGDISLLWNLFVISIFRTVLLSASWHVPILNTVALCHDGLFV